jgi:hypothetical protein
MYLQGALHFRILKSLRRGNQYIPQSSGREGTKRNNLQQHRLHY